MRRNPFKGHVTAGNPLGCSSFSAAFRKIVPSRTLSPRLAPIARHTGLLSHIFGRFGFDATGANRMFKYRMLRRLVRETALTPPVTTPPRLPAWGFAVLPTAISACAPLTLRSLSEPIQSGPRSSLLCTSMRLRCTNIVEYLIGRRLHSRISLFPALAS
jgi:hypothetical protein